MKLYYAILYQDKIWNNIICKTNPRGFTYNEATEIIENNKWDTAKLININEDIEIYNVKEDIKYKCLFDYKEDIYIYYLWDREYSNNNINGIHLPIEVENNNEYIDKLKEIFKRFLNLLDKIAFKYRGNPLDDAEKNCNAILKAIDCVIDKKMEEAENIINEIISSYIEDDFWVSELDKSYAFRGLAPFYDLRYEDEKYKTLYNKMLEEDITFYRARINNDNEKISELKHMVHLPYSMRYKAREERFSIANEPCFYFGTTSYICSKECQFNKSKDDLVVSAFKFNEFGKKLKILNLIIPEPLINGIGHVKELDKEAYRSYLQNSMIKLMPFVIATSFSITGKEREIKYEYIISQLLMKTIAKLEIDGIAYLSAQREDDFQYPHCVNLAIPTLNIPENKEYSCYCKMFKMTKPISINYKIHDKINERSYINKIYNNREDFHSKVKIDGELTFYGDTDFSKFDDILISQQFYDFNS